MEKKFPIETNKNKAAILLLPTLFSNKETCFYSLIEDTFISKKSTSKLVILYTKLTRGQIKILQVQPGFNKIEETIDRDGLKYPISFNIDPSFNDDIDMFLESKYSLLSDELKVRIKVFHKAKSNGALDGVLFKRRVFKEQMEEELNHTIPEDSELWDPIGEEEFIDI